MPQLSNRTLLLALPFGTPNLVLKWDILRRNLKYMATAIPNVFVKIDVELYIYDADLPIPADILDVSNQYPGIKLNVVRQKGIVGDFFRLFITPERLVRDKYNYVAITLDDVEITTNIDFKRLLILKRFSGAHCLMPTLSADSTNIVYRYMVHDPNATYSGRVVSIAEFFWFLFDTKSYIDRYYPLLDEQNPFGWGIDLIGFEQTGLRVLQVNSFIVKHHIQGESYAMVGRNAHADMLKYLTERSHTVESLWNKRMVMNIINMSHLSESEWDHIWNQV